MGFLGMASKFVYSKANIYFNFIFHEISKFSDIQHLAIFVILVKKASMKIFPIFTPILNIRRKENQHRIPRVDLLL